ncbi:MAG: DUF2064 domain-containing protein, partial [Anaerolineae bacterium]
AKTRLAAGIGDEAAAGVYARLLYELLLALAPRAAIWNLELATAEVEDVAYFQRAFPEFHVTPQARGDLGRRMAAQLGRHLAAGAPAAIVVGSDIPDLGPGIIARAVGALAGAPLVLGPAADGGFYLIGVASSLVPTLPPGAHEDLLPDRLHHALLADVDWSGGRELASVLDAARKLGLTPPLLPTLADLDRAADLPD